MRLLAVFVVLGTFLVPIWVLVQHENPSVEAVFVDSEDVGEVNPNSDSIPCSDILPSDGSAIRCQEVDGRVYHYIGEWVWVGDIDGGKDEN